MPPIHTYDDYKRLRKVAQLQPGDLLLKKVFNQTLKGLTEWVITKGQKLFSGDKEIKVGSFFSREKFRIAYLGHSSSEHAAVVIAPNEIAEAVGIGVITVSIQGRRNERYCVYRCSNHQLTDAAVEIAKGLSHAYHNVVTGSQDRVTTGGGYSIKGAIQSNFRNQTFQHDSTNQYLNDIIDYVNGVRSDRPTMFCSEFAMACYEAGSLKAFGKTAFGCSPKGMSPMHMEDVLNSRPDLMTLVGKYDSEDDRLFMVVEQGLRAYKHHKNWWNKLGVSEASRNASETLQNLMAIGDNDYLHAGLAAFMGTQPTMQLSVRCIIPDTWQLSKTSTLYNDLAAQVKGKNLLQGL